MVKKIFVIMLMAFMSMGCEAETSNLAGDSKYLAVEGVSNAECRESQYVCVGARTDKTLGELARFGRVSLKTFCERNGISESSCVDTVLVPKKTKLLAGKRI
jgi:hypothetical protein